MKDMIDKSDLRHAFSCSNAGQGGAMSKTEEQALIRHFCDKVMS